MALNVSNLPVSTLPTANPALPSTVATPTPVLSAQPAAAPPAPAPAASPVPQGEMSAIIVPLLKMMMQMIQMMLGVVQGNGGANADAANPPAPAGEAAGNAGNAEAADNDGGGGGKCGGKGRRKKAAAAPAPVAAPVVAAPNALGAAPVAAAPAVATPAAAAPVAAAPAALAAAPAPAGTVTQSTAIGNVVLPSTPAMPTPTPSAPLTPGTQILAANASSTVTGPAGGVSAADSGAAQVGGKNTNEVKNTAPKSQLQLQAEQMSANSFSQPAQTAGVGNAATMTIDQRRAINYSDLRANAQAGETYANIRTGKEAFNGVSGTDAAIMHLAGRAHISAAETASGVSPTARIYGNVLNNPADFTQDEVAVIQSFAQQEIAKYGFVTGDSLDHAMIDQMAARNGLSPEKTQAYHNAINQKTQNVINNFQNPATQAQVVQDTNTPINFSSDLNTLQEQSGLSRFEQATYRLAAHATLFSGNGAVNGDILAITIGNANSLDGKTFTLDNGVAQDTNIDNEALQLLQDDMASNGVLDGDALRFANEKVMDKLYLGAGNVSNADVQQFAAQRGQNNGLSAQSIGLAFKTSAADAVKQFGQFAKEHPMLTAGGAAALAAGSAVCPFLGGAVAATAGVMAGQKLLNGANAPTPAA